MALILADDARGKPRKISYLPASVSAILLAQK